MYYYILTASCVTVGLSAAAATAAWNGLSKPVCCCLSCCCFCCCCCHQVLSLSLLSLSLCVCMCLLRSGHWLYPVIERSELRERKPCCVWKKAFYEVVSKYILCIEKEIKIVPYVDVCVLSPLRVSQYWKRAGQNALKGIGVNGSAQRTHTRGLKGLDSPPHLNA